MLKAKDFRQKAWAALSGKWGTMALCAFIMSLILGACSSFSATSRFTPAGIGLTFTFIGGVGTLLLTGPLNYGMAVLSLNVTRGGEIDLNKLFEGFKNFSKSFVLYLINSIFIALWSLLLIIPGIIKTLSYSMSYYILIDHPELAPNEARKQSMAMMHGNKWRLFCLEFSFIGWLILCILTLGILSFWITPYQNVARAEFYQSLLDEKQSAQPEGENVYGAQAQLPEANAANDEVFSDMAPVSEANAEEVNAEVPETEANAESAPEVQPEDGKAE